MTTPRMRSTSKKIMLQADVVRGFADCLRRLRRARGMSQANLATRAQLHWTYIGRLERGLKSPSLEIVARLAEALAVPISELLAPGKPADSLAFQHQQARTQLESILKNADPSILSILNALLALLEDAAKRGRS